MQEGEPKRRASRVKVITATRDQMDDAYLMHFAILISGRVQTPLQALTLSMLMIKLRDRARLHVKRLARQAIAPTPSLARRIRTVRTHLDAIIDGIKDVHGTRELSIVVGDNGAVSLVYGGTRILVGV